MVTFQGERDTRWSYDPSAELGRGAYGAVYRGADEDGRFVAIKRIEGLAGDQAWERIREREVQVGEQIKAAGSRIRHLVAPIDIGRSGTDLFIVMPLADRSLADALREELLDENARLTVIEEITQGLVELAELSLVHRDLKPRNVLYLDGSWRLADFGIARELEASTATHTFRGQGTAEYKAPEVWKNQTATVKTDLYALGVVAYQVLHDSLPFEGPTEDDFRIQHLQSPPASPTHPNPAISRLLLRLLMKDQYERPQDARDVLQALRDARRQLPQQQLVELQQAALKATQRRAAREVEQQVTQSTLRRAAERRVEAIRELQHILSDAVDHAQKGLPGEITLVPEDAPSYRTPLHWHITWQEQRVLTLSIWLDTDAYLPDDDPFVIGGTVIIPRPHDAGGGIVANLACQEQTGRLVWSVLEFGASYLGSSTGYDLGPSDRLHGFGQPNFVQQRQYMLSGGVHVWTMTSSPLTVDTILRLLTPAIEAAD